MLFLKQENKQKQNNGTFLTNSEAQAGVHHNDNQYCCCLCGVPLKAAALATVSVQPVHLLCLVSLCAVPRAVLAGAGRRNAALLCLTVFSSTLGLARLRCTDPLLFIQLTGRREQSRSLAPQQGTAAPSCVSR